MQQTKGEDLQNLIIITNSKCKLTYMINTTLNALFACEFYSSNNLHTCQNLHEFLLSPFNKENETKLKEHTMKVLTHVKMDGFTRSIRNLQSHYKKEYNKNNNLTFESFILQNKTLSKEKLQDSIKRYSRNARQQKTTTTPPTNIMCLPVSPIQAKGSNQNFANNNNTESLDSEDFELFSFSSFDSLPLLPVAPSTTATSTNMAATLKAPTASSTLSVRVKERNSSKRNSTNSTTIGSPTKPSPTETPKKKRKKKIVAISSSLERIQKIDTKTKASIAIQQSLSTIFQNYEDSEVVEAFNKQVRINNICDQLKHWIEIASNSEESNGTREGFNVAKSYRMGYHSKNGPLKGFNIKIGSKHVHDFKLWKQADYKQQIWKLGLELWKMMKGNSCSTDDSVCMEFGFMEAGDSVVEVKLYYIYHFLY